MSIYLLLVSVFFLAKRVMTFALWVHSPDKMALSRSIICACTVKQKVFENMVQDRISLIVKKTIWTFVNLDLHGHLHCSSWGSMRHKQLPTIILKFSRSVYSNLYRVFKRVYIGSGSAPWLVIVASSILVRRRLISRDCDMLCICSSLL